MRSSAFSLTAEAPRPRSHSSAMWPTPSTQPEAGWLSQASVVSTLARPTRYSSSTCSWVLPPLISAKDVPSLAARSSFFSLICWITAAARAFVRRAERTRKDDGRSSCSRPHVRRGARNVAAEHATNQVAYALLTERGGRRDFVPLARGFLQSRVPGGGPGPLSRFVSSHRRRALQLYLLAHALASVEPYDVALSAKTWGAALGLPDTASSRVLISQSWSWLECQRLLRTARDGRLRRVWLLDDTGSGEPYAHGGAAVGKRDYFKLSHAFWYEGWHERLDLPATAVLLIGLSLRQSFSLPYERAGTWYGLSRDTVRRGVAELRSQDILAMRAVWRATMRSPTGATEERRYTLAGAFASQNRRAKPRASAPTSSPGNEIS